MSSEPPASTSAPASGPSSAKPKRELTEEEKAESARKRAEKKAEKAAKTNKSGVKVPKGTRDSTPEQMVIRERVFALIKGIFQRHGACSIDTPVFELKETLTGKYGEDSKLIYDLAAQGGEICALRYDLTVPFARYIADHGVDQIKRYHIGRVYRRDNPAIERGRYREFFQMDFDIAGSYGAMIPDSDCLKVLTEILDSLHIGGYLVKINHRKLLDALLSVAGVPTEKIRPISSAIDKLDKEPWSAVRDEMTKQKGLEEKAADFIGQFVQIKGNPLEVLNKLKEDSRINGNESAQAAFKDMELLFDYLTALNCINRFSFDLSLARGLEYYTGVIYEAVLTETDRVGSIAAGGRYDNLVGSMANKHIPAVGVSIGIERIFSILEELEMKRGNIRKNHTDVYVASVGNGFLKTRMMLCENLWANGIAAEFLYEENPKPSKQMDIAVKNAVPFMVWTGEDEEKQGVVKLKLMEKKEEFIVKKEELVAKLKEIRGHKHEI